MRDYSLPRSSPVPFSQKTPSNKLLSKRFTKLLAVSCYNRTIFTIFAVLIKNFHKHSKRMRISNNLFNLFTLLIVGLAVCSIGACSVDDAEPLFKETTNNNITIDTTGVAVTGEIEKQGITYAHIKGYANLNLLPTGSGEIGVEICPSGEEVSAHQKTSSTLSDNAFVIEFDNLTPDTEYRYRSFVRSDERTYYGQYNTLTTNALYPITTTVDATDLTRTSATIISTVQTALADPIDNLMVGVAYSLSEQAFETPSEEIIFCGEQSAGDVPDGILTVTLRELSEATTYYYTTYTKASGEYCFAKIKSFTTYGDDYTPSGAVDLGLSVMWATCNIGADSPEEYGDYYAWGEIEPKEKYEEGNYKWYDKFTGSYIKYCTDATIGTVDDKTVLDPEDDVAHVKLGGGWRMPTEAEIIELCKKCTWEEDTTYNGIEGSIVIGPNGNSIFLPAGGYYSKGLYSKKEKGYYWASTLETLGRNGDNYRPKYGESFTTNGNELYRNRYYGCSVRPVIK